VIRTQGEVEFDGTDPAMGLMGLRGTNLEDAAALTDLPVQDVATLRDANVLGAALLLAAWAEEEGIDTEDLAAWAPIVARYSGIENEEAAAEYVHYEVYRVLAEGLELEGVYLPATDVTPNFRKPSRVLNERLDDGSAIWSPSPNNSSRSGYVPEYVIIHTCEGSYSGCWGWLTNSASGVSAHYVVNDAGSEVRQLVDEDRKAWHIAANYDCNNNNGYACSDNGKAMNSISVGIEHAGYASQSSWSEGLLNRSAALTCGITQRHNIPRTSYHIVGHGQMQPWSRTDPGPNWPWTDYLNRVKTACGEGTTPTTPTTPTTTGASGLPSQFVIDSNNGANDTSRFKVEVGSAWWASASTSGFYNTGYWATKIEPNSNLVGFRFDSDASQCFDVDAWWTAGTNRYSAATFIATDANGHELGRAVVDQRSNGSKWNRLGRWTFPAGTNRVSLSRWGSGNLYVVADAVRLTACN
jgi:N-acetyl-anhydromuramyl-L-alanine amidase AmpD